MARPENSELLKLSDTGQTVASVDEDIRDRHVKDRNGEDLGKVDDLLVDAAENKVRFMVVASGGFLGLGQDKSFIPIDAITNINGGQVQIDQTREHVAQAPAYDPDLTDEGAYYQDVYGYYGYAPFWGPGYAYPAYPYYR